MRPIKAVDDEVIVALCICISYAFPFIMFTLKLFTVFVIVFSSLFCDTFRTNACEQCFTAASSVYCTRSTSELSLNVVMVPCAERQGFATTALYAGSCVAATCWL